MKGENMIKKMLMVLMVSFPLLVEAASLSLNNGGGATNITSTSAWLNVSVTSTGNANPYVWIFWGTNNGNSNSTAWLHTNVVGVCTVATYSVQATSLPPSMLHYYRAYATNGTQTNWSSISALFRTISAPTTAPPSSVQTVTVDTNDVIKHPTNLFMANTGLLGSAMSTIGTTNISYGTTSSSAYRGDWGSALSNDYRSEDAGISNSLNTVSNAFRNSDVGISNAFIGADSGLSNAFQAADTGISNAFHTADTGITNSYQAADTGISNAYKTADQSVSNGFIAADAVVTNSFIVADTGLSNSLALKANLAGAIFTGPVTGLIFHGNGEGLSNVSLVWGNATLTNLVLSGAGLIPDVSGMYTQITADAGYPRWHNNNGYYVRCDGVYNGIDSVGSGDLGSSGAWWRDDVAGSVFNANYGPQNETCTGTVTVTYQYQAIWEAGYVTNNDAWLLKRDGIVQQGWFRMSNTFLQPLYGNGLGLTNISVPSTNAMITAYQAVDTGISNAFKAADTGISNSYKAADAGISNDFHSADANISNQFQIADTGISNSYASADTAVSNGVTVWFQTADTGISNAYKSADTAVSNGVTVWFQAADTGLTNAYKAADTAVSNGVIAQYQTADTGISNSYDAADTSISNVFRAADTGISNAIALKLDLTGGTMTGPLTNNLAYYGDGKGLTNMIAPEATNALALGNIAAAEWSSATNNALAKPYTNAAYATVLQVTGSGPTNGAEWIATNTAGEGAWSSPVYFKGTRATTFNFSNAVQRILVWDNITNNYGGAFDGTTFVTPKKGVYHFVYFLSWLRVSGSMVAANGKILANGVTVVAMDAPWDSDSTLGNAMIDSGYIYLTNGVAITCAVLGKDVTTNQIWTSRLPFFSGALIRELP